jgi:hypothetical protein
MNPHETTRELDAARAKYRGQIIPKPALAIMDAKTARLAASDLASGALKTGDSEKNKLAFPALSAAGVRWFLKEDLALSVEARYLHLSCAGMDSPNLGLNKVNGMLGISWFF